MIKITKRPKLTNAVLVAAWPGMGNVAFRAATFLKDTLKAKEFARIDSSGLFYPADVVIEQSVVKLPPLPKGVFYWHQGATDKVPLVIFISDAQVGPEKSLDYAYRIVDAAVGFGVRRVYTFAAMPLPIDHFHQPQVWGAGTHKRISDELKRSGIKPLDTGKISGLNGLFLGAAKERGLSGACLLGEIPLYTIQIDNPKASAVVLEELAKLLKLNLDVGELTIAGKVMEDEIEKLIDYLKASQDEASKPISDEEIDKIKKMLAAQSRIPDSAQKKIELLFAEARQDLSRASALKQELDKWSIYKDYEDRFLDLFKRRENQDN